MCGVVGFYAPQAPMPLHEAEHVLRQMTNRLEHRGPDDSGCWIDGQSGVALGQTRLAIVDLSPLGHQPMDSANGEWTIVFNGEIYNFHTLRQELASLGVTFKGHSDTEVLVEGFNIWGVRPTIEKCVGMFAIAAWNHRERELTLVRDRLGKKPLYYGCIGQTWFFASELKALHPHPRFEPRLNRNAIPLYLRHNYIPGPYSIYEHIWKLQPGTILTINAQGQSTGPQTYWSMRKDASAKGLANPFQGTFEEALLQLENLLENAIELRMIADVPLGSFLSGGIDSSLVTALMQKVSSKPVRTFSIGFEDPAYDEAPFAKAIAQHLKTDHVEHIVSGREALDVIPLLPEMFDEPFADSSQIPTYLVSKLARQSVTVALSGDGGDEFFCGYRRYFQTQQIASILQRIPGPARSMAAKLCQWAVPLAKTVSLQWQKRFSHASHLFSHAESDDLYLSHMQYWTEQSPGTVGIPWSSTEFMNRETWLASPHAEERWMDLDSRTYLPDDILTKVDRTSMAVALETRAPLIDHRVIEFAWSLPLDFKRQANSGKIPLKRILNKYVPAELFERPKKGFGVPMERWLCEDLRDWAEDLLSEHSLNATGFYNTPLIRQRWHAHTHGQPVWNYHLWGVLMLQAWLRTWPH